jgi:putative hemolysin
MMGFELAVIFFLILLNGFLVLSELAVISSRRSRLVPLIEQGSLSARLVLEKSEDPGRLLSAIQLGITLIGTLTGAFGGASVSEHVAVFIAPLPMIGIYAPSIAFGIVVVVITFVTLVLGELVPKRLALANPERLAVLFVRPLAFLEACLAPIVNILSGTTNFVLRIFGTDALRNQQVTEAEVISVIADGEQAGVIAREEREMVEEVLNLADRSVRSIMTPRRDVYWIDPGDPQDIIREEILRCPGSRIVIARSDTPDEPLGVIHKRDVLGALIEGKDIDVLSLMTQPIYVPETASVFDVLQGFKQKPIHIAFVVDEYGTFEGLLTITDILTAITGDLPDVHNPAGEKIIPRHDGSFLVDGRCDLDDLFGLMGIKTALPDDIHTAAGYVLHLCRRLPKEGERLAADGWIIEIVDMDGHRIDKLLMRRDELSLDRPS